MSIVSTYPNSTYIVAETYAATSWVMADGKITWSDPTATTAQLVTKYNAISKASLTPGVTEVLQETKLAFLGVNNSVYQIIIQQWNPVAGKTMTQTFTYTSDATATNSEVYTYFKNAVDAAIASGQLFLTTSTSVDPDLIMKGIPNYPKFTVTIIQQPAGGITLTATTAGVVGVGTPAALALKGITVNPSIPLWTTVHLEYAPVTGQNIKDPVAVNSVFDLYLSQSEGDYVAVLAAITADLDGSSPGDAIALI